MSSRLETQGTVEGLGRLEGVSEEEELEAEEGSPPPAVEVFTREGAALEEEGVEDWEMLRRSGVVTLWEEEGLAVSRL